MMFMGLLLAFIGVLYGFFWWTIDWWHPPTITGTKIGIEDILLGFTNGGIGAVIYQGIFRMRLSKRSKDSHMFGLVMVILLLFFITSLLFWIFHLTSFIATSVSMIISGIVLVYLRKDLFVSSLISGLLLLFVSAPVYFILILVSPGFIEKVWDFQKISGVLVAGIPVEDLVFYFLSGFLIAFLYKYGIGGYLKRI